MQLDCLAIAAHPDDAELFAGGTLALLAARGRAVGILDLTAGEMATRGTPETRAREAQAAAEVLGLVWREGFNLGDGEIANSQVNRHAVVELIRRMRPRLILTHAPEDRHPDHRRANELVRDAVFFANVGNFPAVGERWKVEAVAFFPGNTFSGDPRADWVVDISEVYGRRHAALEAYATQFLSRPDDPNTTYIASRAFWEQLQRRAQTWGHRIGAEYGEPFIFEQPAHLAHPLVQLLNEKSPPG